MSLFEKEKMHLVLFVTRMVVMGFVRATCSRGGSVCKDWFDRAGKMVYWLKRNVLSVADFVWAKEGMELELCLTGQQRSTPCGARSSSTG